MNDSQIEDLLRHPPRPVPPAGLKAQLLADIRLPKGKTDADTAASSRDSDSIPISFWGRWTPATLAFGALLLSCFILVAWQTGEWWSLRRENQTLNNARRDLAELRATKEGLEQQTAATDRTALAAREQQELAKLREEFDLLTAREKEAAAYLAENTRLRTELAAARAGQGAAADPFVQSQERAKRIQCVSNMKQIGLALRMWSNDHKDVFPTDFLSASNEMNTPKILTCPGDTARQRASSWREFNGSNLSYEFLNAGGDETDPQVVLTRCPIHHNVGMSDGSVMQLTPQHRVEQIDGKWRIVTSPRP